MIRGAAGGVGDYHENAGANSFAQMLHWRPQVRRWRAVYDWSGTCKRWIFLL